MASGDEQDKLVHSKQLKRKGQIPGITQKWHLKEVSREQGRRRVNEWNGVDPFGQSLRVPHLPEETADERRERNGDEEAPIMC